MAQRDNALNGMNNTIPAQAPDAGAHFGLHSDYGYGAQTSQPPDKGTGFGLYTEQQSRAK